MNKIVTASLFTLALSFNSFSHSFIEEDARIMKRACTIKIENEKSDKGTLIIGYSYDSLTKFAESVSVQVVNNVTYDTKTFILSERYMQAPLPLVDVKTGTQKYPNIQAEFVDIYAPNVEIDENKEIFYLRSLVSNSLAGSYVDINFRLLGFPKKLIRGLGLNFVKNQTFTDFLCSEVQ